MVHAAMYDAVNAIDQRYEPYLVQRPAQRWYSEDAAAATAAYRVLVNSQPPVVLPADQPALVASATSLYDASLAAIPPGPAKPGSTDGVVERSGSGQTLSGRLRAGRMMGRCALLAGSLGPFPVGFGCVTGSGDHARRRSDLLVVGDAPVRFRRQWAARGFVPAR